MNVTEHLLACLAEECAEVVQRATKALRFGLLEIQPGQPLNNAERLAAEIVDVLAIVDMLAERGALGDALDTWGQADLRKKKTRVKRFMRYARQIGALDEGESE